MYLQYAQEAGVQGVEEAGVQGEEEKARAELERQKKQRGCYKASGLKWRRIGVTTPTALGLQWRAVGATGPTEGRRLALYRMCSL